MYCACVHGVCVCVCVCVSCVCVCVCVCVYIIILFVLDSRKHSSCNQCIDTWQ